MKQYTNLTHKPPLDIFEIQFAFLLLVNIQVTLLQSNLPLSLVLKFGVVTASCKSVYILNLCIIYRCYNRYDFLKLNLAGIITCEDAKK